MNALDTLAVVLAALVIVGRVLMFLPRSPKELSRVVQTLQRGALYP